MTDGACRDHSCAFRTPPGPARKKCGGQPGHPKHEWVILPPDHTLKHMPTRCQGYAAAFAGGIIGWGKAAKANEENYFSGTSGLALVPLFP